MNADLHTLYRPKTLEQVVGHPHVVESLSKVLAKRNVRSFIFTGPTGTGKTTLARIVASELGCSKDSLVEVDAATHTGVEAMRDITANLQFAALGESSIRVYIIDEAHMLSTAAWNSLLKPIEEPPPHIAFVFCTTLAGKIPPTIANRCATYNLTLLNRSDIWLILKRVVKKANIEIKQEIIDFLANNAGGSARRALTWLAQAQHMKSRKDVAKLLRQSDEESGEAVELCRLLIRGTNWARASECCKKMKDMNPESIRMIVMAYFTKVLLDAKNEKHAAAIMDIVEAFADPYPQGATIAHVLLSLGSILL